MKGLGSSAYYGPVDAIHKSDTSYCVIRMIGGREIIAHIASVLILYITSTASNFIFAIHV